jgi:hypothetical protein
MKKKKCEFCSTEYWDPPGGHECYSVPNQLLAELMSNQAIRDLRYYCHVTHKARQILDRIERLLKKGGE